MGSEPVVVQESAREWETWPEEVSRKGLVYWRTLISGDVTRSEALTMGFGRMPPGEALRRHRHRPAEVYLLLEGTGSVEIGAEAWPVEAGSAVFIPGNVFHSLANTGDIGPEVRLRVPGRLVQGGRVCLRRVAQDRTRRPYSP